jgi:hypothetical protein
MTKEKQKAGDKIAIVKENGKRAEVTFDVVDKIQGGKIKTKGGKEFDETSQKDNNGKKATTVAADFEKLFTNTGAKIEKIDANPAMLKRLGIL